VQPAECIFRKTSLEFTVTLVKGGKLPVILKKNGLSPRRKDRRG
jgi:hypothetical protein